VIVIMKRYGRMPRKLLAAALAGGLFLLPSGCGVFENAGTVSGTVRYKGQPLTEGSVSFVSEKGQVATGSIDKSGHYVVSRVPVGPAKVTVQVVSSEGPPPMSFVGAAKPEQGTATGSKIPLRYGMAATSGLQHNVTKGKQQFDIDLKE
jgi:hypothetical protein